jgi:short-subunit dehydrogenase
VSLSGRVAAITGASSGIGAACARVFARAGLGVSLAARRGDALGEVAAEVRRAGGRALAVVADVTSEEDMRRLVDRTLAELGRLDVMVCNAGAGYHGTLGETDAGVMRRLMDVNFMGTFHAARAAMAHFEREGRGHLLIVSSIVGRRGMPFYEAYSATKFAQAGLGEALRAEYAGTAIRVSIVYPVSTVTGFRDAMSRDFGHTIAGGGPEQSAAAVAGAMLRCLRRPRAEVFPLRTSRLWVLLSTLAPGVSDRFAKRVARRRITSPEQPRSQP